VGAGPAGLAFATVAAERGHQMTLFEKSESIGGQFNLAKRIPGKEEFEHTINYYQHQLKKYQVDVRLNTEATLELLKSFDEVVLASGIKPRMPDIKGITHEKVMTYIDVILQKKTPGQRVAVIGAGGIGFDIVEWLTQDHGKSDPSEFYNEWGIDLTATHRGGIKQSKTTPSRRQVTILQRKKGKLGQSLGKTTGWIHRLSTKLKKVEMLAGVTYVKIDDQGLHLLINNKPRLLIVDSVVICTGQLELRSLFEPLKQAGLKTHLIGGAYKALELDARHAINQACRLAALI
jgi:2,4-dienoyl-CoA reductase (NADPH2)